MSTLPGHLTDAQAQRLVDGALSPAETHAIERHVAACAECRAAVESYRALVSALEDLGTPSPPADFTEAVLARIDARERSAARERMHAFAIFAGVAVAALAAFAVAGPAAWAPAVSSLADVLGRAARTFQVAGSFVPALVGALRMQIILVAAAAALPLLLLLARLVPQPRGEAA